ncbi:MAG TPA: ABC transporter ATP-binding protein [Vicinamibacterales bacterium]|nr:ABC transporter ATP-binding protein [Vicinamibacterales bacterium]
MNAIEIVNASKVYRRYSHRKQFATLKSALLSRSLVRDLTPEETFPAVRNVTISVPRGQTLGVIGRNGSGKSTLLKLVAGITKPTSGGVHVTGRISALIELGAGFHPEISGRENVFINGIMLGLSKREITRRFDEIVEFAELREFIDAPVKTYSSGMYMRLGFAVAIHVDPDVLLVDEVLAVGDEGFTHKCLDKFAEFKRRGRTILLVTHSLGLVEKFCDEALWMDAGRMKLQGDPKRVVGAYLTDVQRTEEQQLAAADARAREAVTAGVSEAAAAGVAPRPADVTEAPADMFRATEGRWGSREIEIAAVDLIGRDGQPAHVFQSGDPFTIRLRLRAPQALDDFVLGVGIFNAEGVCCYGTNTNIEQFRSVRVVGDAQAEFHVPRLDLVEGTYKLDLAVHKLDGYPYDYHRLLYTFRVKSRTKDVGIYRPEHSWNFSPSIQFSRDDD